MPVPSFVEALGSVLNPALPCTPGAELWVTPGNAHALTTWVSGGICPPAGVVNMATVTVPKGNTIQNHFVFALIPSNGTINWDGATVFQDTRPVSDPLGGGSGSGGQVTGELTLAPFEYTEAQQLEVYQAMATIFGAGLVALAAIWGLKRIYLLLNTDTARGD